MQHIKHNFKLYLKSKNRNFNMSKEYKDWSKTDQKLQAKILKYWYTVSFKQLF